MKKYMVGLLVKCINFTARKLLELSSFCVRTPSKLLEKGEMKSLYETPAGIRYWLNSFAYLDLQIINNGVFEKNSTNIVNQFVKEGDFVLDVGANIGYYTVILSKLVGKKGKVLAFEPTKHFRHMLEKNISMNEVVDNIEIIDVGLSNKKEELTIDIGPSSATLHSPQGYDQVLGHEKISLMTLDAFVKERKIDKIDFIKIDVDGHEAFFFDGAGDTLERLSPMVLFEISHLHYLEAGVTAWDFYDSIKSKDYNLFHEDDLMKIKSKEDFLRRCSNFDKTCNIVMAKRDSLDSF